MAESVTGSCLCRSVKYVIRNEIMAVANCHCKTCKKITGGVFETIAVVDEKQLEIIAGKELLRIYQIGEKATKHFCSTCGTPIFNQHKKYPNRCLIHVGSFDNPAFVTPAINIFCESMLPWVKEIAHLKCFEQEPVK